MKIYQKRIYREDLQANPNCVYLFGDNLLRTVSWLGGSNVYDVKRVAVNTPEPTSGKSRGKSMNRAAMIERAKAFIDDYDMFNDPDEGLADFALQEIDQYKIALADAIRRPMGVVPDSAEGLVDARDIDRAETRRMAKVNLNVRDIPTIDEMVGFLRR